MTLIIDSKYLITPFILGMFLGACGQASPKPMASAKNKSSQFASYDTASISMITFDRSDYWLFDSTSKPSILTNADILEVERLFNEAVAEYNSKLKSGDNKLYFSIDFMKYKYRRQYVCVTSKDRQKEVYINCFCETMGVDWKNKLIQVEDGGNCFFNLKINLNTKRYFDIFVNGYA
jgi:hypothetical protein